MSPGWRSAFALRTQLSMPGTPSRAQAEPPIEYRDRKGGLWQASEVAQLRVVSPAIDGPNLCLVIRFEREGEERFAWWIGGEDWRQRGALHRLFTEAELVEAHAAPPVVTPDRADGPEPP